MAFNDHRTPVCSFVKDMFAKWNIGKEDVSAVIDNAENVISAA